MQKASSTDVAKDADAFSQMLVSSGALTENALLRARHLQVESGEVLSAILTKLGLISERQLAEAFSAYLNLPVLKPDDFPDDPILESQINAKFLRWARLIPVSDEADKVVVAMADPLDGESVEILQFALQKPIDRRVALSADIDAAYQRLYAAPGDESSSAVANAPVSDDIDRLKDMASEAPVIRLVNQIIDGAVEARASDIHIEPEVRTMRLRYRVDGVLQEMDAPPVHLRNAIISRIKIMARLNIAERRVAQDGRIRLSVRGREIDLRVTTSPTLHGESVVMRILDRDNLALDFAELGFDEDVLTPFLEVLHRPNGILLVTGPTGSGKTTTLYASLLNLNTPEKKILTIEDPVEYQLEGINQHQVKAQVGLTFASALRSFLRQDPDIMMVGEVRDQETAQIAVQAALTGHMLLSTLHTNNAASAVTRLLDMGVEDYLLTTTVNGILGQRLVRRLCSSCREAYVPGAELCERLQITEMDKVLYRSVGCPQCGGTGYLGRTMIVEFLPLTEEIRALVLKHAAAQEIEQVAIKNGMRTLAGHGLSKVMAGVTSLEEVFRVVGRV